MREQVLYRKYRSGNFAEVIGQDHIVRTLTAALASGHLAHAYLFTGPKGVGKTSVARLLARAINCTGDNPKPCGKCTMCSSSASATVDLIEIDAASNRSIDSIRDLREKVALAPTVGSHKVYIIDEVHMLTTEAFNALLKTLEEPPSHAVFILATTEAHKVPETIISRTQAFAFKPISETDIVRHLTDIASKEGINIASEALASIAAAARGGFRDAISLLDQLSASGEPITAQTVQQVIGFSAVADTLKLANAIAAANPAGALSVLTRLESAGANPAQICLQLIETLRRTLFAAAGADPNPAPEIKELAGRLGAHRTATAIEQLIETSRSPWPALALQAAVVKLCVPAPTAVQPATPTAPTPAAGRKATPPTASTATAVAAPPSPTADTTTTAADALPSELWAKVLVNVKSKNNSLGALLQMYPANFAPDEVTILPRFNFHRDLFLKAANRTIIEQAASKVYGRPVKVSARTEEDGKPKRRTKAADPSAELVSSALEILGGEVIE